MCFVSKSICVEYYVHCVLVLYGSVLASWVKTPQPPQSPHLLSILTGNNSWLRFRFPTRPSPVHNTLSWIPKDWVSGTVLIGVAGQLVGYTDVDWAISASNCRSTIGNAFSLGSVVARSSRQWHYRALRPRRICILLKGSAGGGCWSDGDPLRQP